MSSQLKELFSCSPHALSRVLPGSTTCSSEAELIDLAASPSQPTSKAQVCYTSALRPAGFRLVADDAPEEEQFAEYQAQATDVSLGGWVWVCLVGQHCWFQHASSRLCPCRFTTQPLCASSCRTNSQGTLLLSPALALSRC